MNETEIKSFIIISFISAVYSWQFICTLLSSFMIIKCLESFALAQFIALGNLQVFAHHLCNHFFQSNLRHPTQLFARLRRVTKQSLHLGRPEITRIDLDQYLAIRLRLIPFSSIPSPSQRTEYRLPCRPHRQNPAPNTAHPSKYRNHPAHPAATSTTASSHNPLHVPSRASNRDYPDTALSCRPSLMRATARVIFRVTNVSPRTGDS